MISLNSLTIRIVPTYQEFGETSIVHEINIPSICYLMDSPSNILVAKPM